MTEQLAQAATSEPIGQVSELEGVARVTRTDGAQETLSLGDPLFLGDTVETTAGSTLSITFVDETLFTLSNEGRLVLDELVYNPGGSGNELGLSLLQGTFAFISGEISKSVGPGISIDTPVGTMGLRGTAGAGDYDLIRLLITVLQGAILFSNNVAQALLTEVLTALNVESPDQADLQPAPLTSEEQQTLGGILPGILQQLGPEAGPDDQGPQEGGEVRQPSPPAPEDPSGINEGNVGSDAETEQDVVERALELAQQIVAELLDPAEPDTASTDSSNLILTTTLAAAQETTESETTSEPPPPPPINLDLDGDNSSDPVLPGGTGNTTGFEVQFAEATSVVAGSGDVPLVDPDLQITTEEGETIISASVNLTTRPDGLLESLQIDAGALPAGIQAQVLQDGAFIFLTGEASPADYAQALALIQYSNLSEDPTETERIITTTLTSEAGVSNTAITTIQVVANNDPPELAAEPADGPVPLVDTPFVEGGGPVTLADFSVLDVDDTELQSATVRIENFEAGEDELLVGLDLAGTGVTASTAVVNENGVDRLVLTLQGAAPLATYENILDSVQYNNTSADPTTATRSITVTANDGENDSELVEVNVPIQTISQVDFTLSGPTLVTEGPNAVAVYTITQSGDLAEGESVTLNFDLTEGNEGDGTDPDATAQTAQVTFTGTADGASQEVTVTINDDTVVEDDEDFTATVTLDTASPTVEATVGGGAQDQVTTTIQDDDVPISQVDFTLSGPTLVTEGPNAVAVYTITQSGDLAEGESVTLNFDLTEGNEGDGTDPDATTATAQVTFTGTADGASQEVTVTINDDTVVEDDEDITATVTLDSASPTVEATVGGGAQDQVTTTIQDNDTADLVVDGDVAGLPDGNLIVGDTAVGSLEVNSGNAGFQSGVVGNQATGLGTVTVTSATLDFGSGSLVVGNEGTGTLDIAGGGQVLAGEGVFGAISDDTGIVTLTGDGSLLDLVSGLTVGQFGTGSLTAEAGADVTIESDNFDNLVIAAEAGSTGSVVLRGDGTTLVTSGLDNTVQVGLAGTGVLLVEDQAQLKTLQFELGRDATGVGTATIQGTGTTVIVSNDEGRFADPYDYEAGFARVARHGEGTLNVLAGARMEVREGQGVNEDTTLPGLQIARNDGSVGTVLVDGEGSIIDITQDQPDAGFGGPFLQIGRGDGSNPGSVADGELTVSGGGEVRLNGQSASFVVGQEATGFGTVTLTGTGSALNVDALGFEGFFGVGSSGVGSMDIEAGASASIAVRFGDVGGSADASGSLTVTGTSSAFSYTGESINIGFQATGDQLGPGGSLLVEDGGIANITAEFTGIATAAGASGAATVTGIGSQLNVVGDLTVGDGFFDEDDGVGTPGEAALGTLDVLDGAAVDIEGFFTLGAAVDGDGTVNVDAASVTVRGSQPDGSGFNINVGLGGTGRMNLSNGASVVLNPGLTITGLAPALLVAFDAGSQGFLDIADSEIRIQGNTGFFALGEAGDAAVTLTDGQLINEADSGSGIIARQAGSTADVTVDGSDAVLDGNETLNIGVAGAALLDILNGGLVTAGNMVLADQAGSSAIVTLDGLGSTLSADNDIVVGNEGTADLSVTGGAQVLAGGLVIGAISNLSGTMTVSGTGSSLAVDGGITVGDAGTGSLTVEAGASVTTASDTFDNLLIARQAGSTGNVTLRGEGTSLVASGLDNAVLVGFAGTGSLLVEDLALLKTLDLQFGFESTAQGTGTIQGAGTSVIVSNDDGRFPDPYDYEAGFARVARDGQGTLSVLDGALLQIREGQGVNEDTTVPGLQVARNDGSVGTVLVDGDGSLIEITRAGPDVGFGGPFLSVGRGDGSDPGTGAEGALTISSGGEVRLNGESSNVTFGVRPTGQGALTVTGEGSVLNVDALGVEGRLHIGFEGSGTLLVEDQGVVNFAGAFVGIGTAAGSSGQATVTGEGSQINVSGLFGVGDGFFDTNDGVGTPGEAAEGRLDILAGADVTVDGFFVLGGLVDGDGTVVLNGQDTSLVTRGTDNGVFVGSAGTGDLTVDNGALLKTLDLEFGIESTAQGTGTIQGAGTTVIVSNDDGRFSGNFDYEAGFVRVARDGQGSLTVLDGALLEIREGQGVNEDTTVPSLQIGRNDGSHGTMLVDGDNTKVIITQAGPDTGFDGPILQVGRGNNSNPAEVAEGELSVTGGALVSLAGVESTVLLGQQATAKGTLTLSGQGLRDVPDEGTILVGSELNVDALGEGGFFAVGHNGEGIMRVEAGALARIAVQFGNVGNGATADGELTVTGQGSLFDFTGNSFNIGFEGTGDLLVEDEGIARFSADFVTIGNVAGSSGTVEVTGEGSEFEVTGDLDVGTGGSGSLTVSDGGTVSATNINIGPDGRLDGDGGTIVGNVFAEGHVAPGASTGAMTIDGDLTVQGGTLELEIASTSDFDTLSVTGQLDFADGIIHLFFVGDAPQSDDQYTLLSSGNPITANVDNISIAITGVSAEIELDVLELGANEVTVEVLNGAELSNTTLFFGSDRNDVFTGGGGDDLLEGGGGDDSLTGGAGSDFLEGGDGGDTFIYAEGDGGASVVLADVIDDFEDGSDLIGLAGGLTFDDLSITESDVDGDETNDTVISVTATGEVLAVLDAVNGGVIDGDDFTIVA